MTADCAADLEGGFIFLLPLLSADTCDIIKYDIWVSMSGSSPTLFMPMGGYTMDQALKDKIKQEVETLGYYLYDLHLAPRNQEKVLTVKIDDYQPISIDDCVTVSEALSGMLDKEDPFADSYVLEVTSAGAEHPLRNLEEMRRAIDRFVYVKTLKMEVRGTLKSVDEASVNVEDKQGRQVTVFMKDIEKIRLAIDF